MKIRFILYFISIFFLNLIHISAEQFKYLSEEIRVLDNGNIILGKNGVEIQIGKYLFISAENFKYSKDLGKLEIFENVKFEDKLNKIYASGKKIIYNESLEIIELIDDVKVNDQINEINLISSKITFNRKINLLQFEEKTKFEDRINKIIGSSSKIFYSLKNQKIYSKSVTSINYDNEYDITFEDFEYDIKNKKISSKYLTKIKDKSENNFEINGFEFNPKINRFIGQKLKFTDFEKNKYFLKDVMINTSNKKIMGRDLDVKFNKLIFNNNKNDPRMSARSVKIDEKSSF